MNEKSISEDTLELDEVGRRIISLLAEDGRLSYSAIAKTLNISETSARQRVQRMRNIGLISIRASVDPELLGLRCRAMVGIRAAGSTDSLIQHLQRISQIQEIRMTTGSFDLMIELLCGDENEAIQLVSSAIRTLPEVQYTETFFYWSPTRPTAITSRCELN